MRADFRAVDPTRSRIVLIGIPHYRHNDLPDVPVVANNSAALAAVLTDPELGGFEADHCVIVPSEADLTQVGDILTGAAGAATDMLLVYYSGHGLIDRRGKLYLSLAGTRPDQLAYSALAFEAIQETFWDSPADNRVLILDSCFSGRAIGQRLAGDGQSRLTALEVSGVFTLASAAANRVAVVLPGEEHTAFTGRLVQLLRQGTPEAGQMLTLSDIYRHLRKQLAEEGLPEPQQHGTNAVGLLGLVRNRQVGTGRQALAASTLPMLVNAGVTGQSADHVPLTRHDEPILAEEYAAIAIERALRITSELDTKQARRVCLAQIAPVVAAVNEHQALSIAAGMTDDRRSSILKDIAVVVATTDIFRAIEITLGVSGSDRGEALAWIAKVDERLHPGKGNGEYILDTYILGGPPHRWADKALREIAVAVAEFAPDRAQKIAAAISDRFDCIRALAEIAISVAVTDPGRALRIVDHLIDTEYPAWIREGKYAGWALSALASAVAVVDPDRALRLLDPIVGERPYPRALVGISRTIARTDPGRALSIARNLTDRAARPQALTAIACAVAATDFDRALDIISLIGAEEFEEPALADIVPALATRSPSQALHLAESITYYPWRVYALSGIASALLCTPQKRSNAITIAG